MFCEPCVLCLAAFIKQQSEAYKTVPNFRWWQEVALHDSIGNGFSYRNRREIKKVVPKCPAHDSAPGGEASCTLRVASSINSGIGPSMVNVSV